MKQRIWKFFGYFSTLLLAAAALLPQIFRVPHQMQPWVFLAAIVWFFLFVTGFWGG
jgi:hypothetical protein